jgi:hypothetical protein
VNVGVVVHCPQTDYFGFRLAPTNGAERVKAFFPDLDIGIFEAGLQGLARELERMRRAHSRPPTRGHISPERAEEPMRRFQEMVRRREGLLHFGESGTLMASDPEVALSLLFERFIERQLPH